MPPLGDAVLCELPWEFAWRTATERCHLLALYWDGTNFDFWAECDARLDAAIAQYPEQPDIAVLAQAHWRGRIERGTARSST